MLRSFVQRTVWAATAVALVLPVLPAQSGLRLDEVLEGFGRGHRIQQVALSPNGKLVAWIGEDGIRVAPPGQLEKSRRLTAAKTGENCQESQLAWAPDSKALAFLSQCGSADQQAQLYLELVEGGMARRLTELHGSISSPAFSPDGARIGFLAIKDAKRPAGATAAMNAPVGVIGEEGFDVQRVASVAVASAEPRQPDFLTPENLYVYEFDWSPDGKALAYVAAAPPGENNWWVAKLYAQPVGGKPRALMASDEPASSLHGLQVAVPRWSPDGKALAFIGGLMSDQGSTGGDLWVVPAGGGQPVNLTLKRKATPAWLQWDGNAALLVSELAGGESRVVRMRLAGDPALGLAAIAMESTLVHLPATVGDGRLDSSLSISSDGSQLAFVASNYEHAPEIFLSQAVDAESAAVAKPISHFNQGVQPAWGKSVSIDWKSGGTQVQGWLLLPKNYDPAKTYPLIVSVHGGPAAVAMPHWVRGATLSPAVFSALGYFVLQPNPRGSFGNGEAFVQANRKDFGYGDLSDILAGVDAVVASYPVDPERVGLMGWSYGGFMTMFAVTQTGRFKAAVAGAGIANWQSYYGQNSIDQWMTPYFGATVYDDPAVYRKSSAIEFIKQAKTPTLMVVGERDGECPPAQSFEFWHGLRAQGVPTRLVVYPGEGHSFSSAPHQRDVVERAAEWFARYLPAR